MSGELWSVVELGENSKVGAKRKSAAKMDRKTAEKKRRMQMKALFSQLQSLVSSGQQQTKVSLLSDQIDEAIVYTKSLEEKLMKMKEEKESLMRNWKLEIGNWKLEIGLQSNHIDIQVLGSFLMVVLLHKSDSSNQFIFYKALRILEEEGAEVLEASFFEEDDKVLHTIHAKIFYEGLGSDEIKEKIRNKLYGFMPEDSNNTKCHHHVSLNHAR